MTTAVKDLARFVSDALDVVASRLIFDGRGGWVENPVRSSYTWPSPNRRASLKLGFLAVLDAGRCRPAGQPSVEVFMLAVRSVPVVVCIHALLFMTQCIHALLYPTVGCLSVCGSYR